MPANGQKDTTGDVAISLIPEFATTSASGPGSKGATGPYWKATRIAMRSGPRPSEAIMEIPLSKTARETAPSVTLVTSSAASGIKGGDYCMVKAVASGGGDGGIYFSGCVTSITHGIKADVAKITAQDFKYLLEGLAIKGSFWNSNGSVLYRQGVHFMPNDRGEPNCSLIGDVPVMCPKRMGLADGEDPGTPTSTTAGYWTVKYVLAAIRYMFANSASASLASDFKEYKQINSQIVWPESYQTGIDDDTLADRRAKEQDYEGMKCLAALNSCCTQAGPFGLFMQPQKDFKNEVKIVRMQYTKDGITISRAAGGNASEKLQGLPIVTDGTYEENFEETYTLVTISGDLVYIERRMTSYGTATFKKAWTTADQTAWKALITTPAAAAISAYSAEAVRAASEKYKKVFHAYKVAEDFDFTAGTTQSDFPRAELARRVLPHLLKQTLSTGSTPSDKYPVDVPIQFEGSDDGTNWYPMPPEHGLRIDEDGILWLSGYVQDSDNGAYGGNTWVGTYTDATTLAALAERYFRVTMAIPCDHRITQNLKVSTDETSGVEAMKKNDDSERISTSLSRVFYADAAELYQRGIQKDSWPEPQTHNDTAAAENDDTLWDDTEKLKDAVKRRLNDLGRIGRSGRLVMPVVHAGYIPGQQIAKLKNDGGSGSYIINSCVHEVVITETPQMTELILG